MLLLVTGGAGALHTLEDAQQQAEGALLRPPRGASRAVQAGDDGPVHLTVHRRRPGMQIGHRDTDG